MTNSIHRASLTGRQACSVRLGLASKALDTFNEDGRTRMQDWWRYAPACIAPASYGFDEWAVGRLWKKANGVKAWAFCLDSRCWAGLR